MKKSLYVFVGIVAVFCACGHEDDNADIRIGVSKSNVHVHTYTPAISGENPSSYSIDLDGDTEDDLVFTKYSAPLLTGFGIGTSMSTKSNTQVVLSVANNYPGALSYKTKL